MAIERIILIVALISLTISGCGKTEPTPTTTSQSLQIQDIQVNTSTDDNAQSQPTQDNAHSRGEEDTKSTNNSMPEEPVPNETPQVYQDTDNTKQSVTLSIKEEIAVNDTCNDCDEEEDHDGTWNDFREIHFPAYSPSENCKMDSVVDIMEICKEICKIDGCDCDDFYNRYNLGKGNEIDEFIKLECKTDDALLCQKLKTAFSSSWDKCIENEKSEMIKYLEDRCTEGTKAWNEDRGECWTMCDINKNDQIDIEEKMCVSACLPGCVEKENFYRELSLESIRIHYKLNGQK